LGHKKYTRKLVLLISLYLMERIKITMDWEQYERDGIRELGEEDREFASISDFKNAYYFGGCLK